MQNAKSSINKLDLSGSKRSATNSQRSFEVPSFHDVLQKPLKETFPNKASFQDALSNPENEKQFLTASIQFLQERLKAKQSDILKIQMQTPGRVLHQYADSSSFLYTLSAQERAPYQLTDERRKSENIHCVTESQISLSECDCDIIHLQSCTCKECHQPPKLTMNQILPTVKRERQNLLSRLARTLKISKKKHMEDFSNCLMEDSDFDDSSSFETSSVETAIKKLNDRRNDSYAIQAKLTSSKETQVSDNEIFRGDRKIVVSEKKGKNVRKKLTSNRISESSSFRTCGTCCSSSNTELISVRSSGVNTIVRSFYPEDGDVWSDKLRKSGRVSDMCTIQEQNTSMENFDSFIEQTFCRAMSDKNPEVEDTHSNKLKESSIKIKITCSENAEDISKVKAEVKNRLKEAKLKQATNKRVEHPELSYQKVLEYVIARVFDSKQKEKQTKLKLALKSPDKQ